MIGSKNVKAFGIVAVVFALGFGILAAPVLWVVWTMTTEEDEEFARIPGPNSLDIVILDTSRGATTGFSYAFDIVAADEPANRGEAVVFLAGPQTVGAAWNSTSAVICADNAKIFHYQNFYNARIDEVFLAGEVVLRSLKACETD